MILKKKLNLYNMSGLRVLVNTVSSKKIAGGGFQIAVNFLLKTLERVDVEWYYVVSSDVDEAIGHNFYALRDKTYFVFPVQPDFKHSYLKVKRALKEMEDKINPNIIYTVNAPCYFKFSTTEVMRFTNPWVTHPNKYSWSILDWKGRIKMKLYCWNQRRLIKDCKYFITQTETTKKGLLRITGLKDNHIKVVKNVLPASFMGVDNRHEELKDGCVHIASVAAASKHKNLDIIPSVISELREKNKLKPVFHLTVPEDSVVWTSIFNEAQRLGVEDSIVNHGRVSQTYLVGLYKKCDFAFLPTLLEVFSASTLEAMYFNLPIVATDFDFNREVMEDAALYYKPTNAVDAAQKLATLISDDNERLNMKKKMAIQLQKFADYNQHFEEILGFLRECSEKDWGGQN